MSTHFYFRKYFLKILNVFTLINSAGNCWSCFGWTSWNCEGTRSAFNRLREPKDSCCWSREVKHNQASWLLFWTVTAKLVWMFLTQAILHMVTVLVLVFLIWPYRLCQELLDQELILTSFCLTKMYDSVTHRILSFFIIISNLGWSLLHAGNNLHL